VINVYIKWQLIYIQTEDELRSYKDV